MQAASLAGGAVSETACSLRIPGGSRSNRQNHHSREREQNCYAPQPGAKAARRIAKVANPIRPETAAEITERIDERYSFCCGGFCQRPARHGPERPGHGR